MIAFLGILGAVIGTIIAEYTVGWTTVYYFGLTEYEEFNEEALIFVGIGLTIGLLIGFFVKKLLSTIEEGKRDQETSSADEIIKLKSLLDNGVITQEEFEAKKKELLNL